MSRRAGTARVTLHLTYQTHAARRRLLSQALPESWTRLEAVRWYAVDLPVATDGGVVDGLEVLADLPGGGTGLEQEAAGWRRAGLVSAVQRADAPMMLQPQLFPGGATPAAYVDALAVGTARAGDLLREREAVREEVVAWELLATYAAFFPRAAERQAALLAYADWLDEVAAHQGLPMGTDTSSAARPVEAMAPVAAAAEYQQLRRRLGGHTARLVRRFNVPETQAAAVRREVAAQVVARLAHIQVVRLAGPRPEGGLRREAALIRWLAGAVHDATRERARH